jgi:hypothetical protein
MKFATRFLGMAAFAMLLGLAACDQEADVASRNLSQAARNLSQAADNFEINRRIVFYNTMNGEYLLQIEGLCNLGNHDTAGRMSVTCKVGPTAFKKHYLGLSPNVTFVAEQINAAAASVYHYRVVFRPSTIIPSVEIR